MCWVGFRQIYAGPAGGTLNSSRSEWIVYGPDGSLLLDGRQIWDRRVDLPSTGTYTAMLRRTSSSYTLSEDLLIGPISLGSVSVPVLVPGGSAVYLYDGVAGERLDVQGHQTTGAGPFFRLYGPDGAFIGRDLHVDRTLPSTGTYRLVVSPTNSPDSGVTLTVSTTGP